MKIKRVFIWGHKANGHTHAYVHYGYYKAFKHLGYETYWVDDLPVGSNDIFKNSLYLTEGQVEKNIPIDKSNIYILHNCENENKKYKDLGCTYLELGNYLKFCETGEGRNHPENKITKIKDLCFYDDVSPTLYQTWATDLLPHEINIEDACLYDSNRDRVHFIGYRWQENEEPIQQFMKACSDNGKTFVPNFRVTFEEDRQLVRESYVCPDFRGPWHIECGYIPCRIFKGLSYGKMVGTNSKHIQDMFPEYVAYAENTYNLFKVCEDHYKSASLKKIQEAMTFVKNNHTYVNRIESILYILKNRGLIE
jgi:hypothetical protein